MWTGELQHGSLVCPGQTSDEHLCLSFGYGIQSDTREHIPSQRSILFSIALMSPQCQPAPCPAWCTQYHVLPQLLLSIYISAAIFLAALAAKFSYAVFYFCLIAFRPELQLGSQSFA